MRGNIGEMSGDKANRWGREGKEGERRGWMDPDFMPQKVGDGERCVRDRPEQEVVVRDSNGHQM